MRPTRQAALGASFLLTLLLMMHSLSLAQAPEDFFGVWADDGKEPLTKRCLHAIEMSEGTWLYLDAELYDEGTGWLCQDLKYWLHGKNLRMSATCKSEESGEAFIPRTVEFEMIKPKVMRRIGTNEKRYKCAGPFTGQPSFPCNGSLDQTAKVVCANKDLANQDQSMSLIYTRIMADASPSAKRSLAATQERWIAARNKCGADHDCIFMAYYDRTKELVDSVSK